MKNLLKRLRLSNGISKDELEFQKTLKEIERINERIKKHGDPFEGMTTIEILDEIRKNK